MSIWRWACVCVLHGQVPAHPVPGHGKRSGYAPGRHGHAEDPLDIPFYVMHLVQQLGVVYISFLLADEIPEFVIAVFVCTI